MFRHQLTHLAESSAGKILHSYSVIITLPSSLYLVNFFFNTVDNRDPMRMRAIPERLRGVFTARRDTNPRLPYLTFLAHKSSIHSVNNREKELHEYTGWPKNRTSLKVCNSCM